MCAVQEQQAHKGGDADSAVSFISLSIYFLLKDSWPTVLWGEHYPGKGTDKQEWRLRRNVLSVEGELRSSWTKWGNSRRQGVKAASPQPEWGSGLEGSGRNNTPAILPTLLTSLLVSISFHLWASGTVLICLVFKFHLLIFQTWLKGIFLIQLGLTLEPKWL